MWCPFWFLIFFYSSYVAKWNRTSGVHVAKITTSVHKGGPALWLSSTIIKLFAHKTRRSRSVFVPPAHLYPSTRIIYKAHTNFENVEHCQSAGVREVWHPLSSYSTPCYKSPLQVGGSRHGIYALQKNVCHECVNILDDYVLSLVTRSKKNSFQAAVSSMCGHCFSVTLASKLHK